jgi:hypothetical protein
MIPPKMLIVCTMTSPSGAPIAALRLAAGLAARGWQCRAVFLYHREAMNNVDFEYDCLLDRPPQSLTEYARMMARLVQLIRQERYDAALGFLPFAMILTSVIARLCGVPVRAVSHRVPTSTYTALMRALDIGAAWTGFYTDVIAVSQSVADSCSSYPQRIKHRTRVVYNGLKDWKPSALSQAQARSHLGLAHSGCLIAAVGRLDVQKNYPLLIAAMAQTGDDCVLAVAGSGPLQDDIQNDINARGLSSRIKLLGALPRADVPVLLAAADIFAQPSLFEGQSNALLEALAAGLPCLVSDVPEQVETVTAPDGKIAGAVLPLGDSEAWGRAIGVFAKREAEFQAAQAATAVQARLFTFDRMIDGFADIFTNALPR